MKLLDWLRRLGIFRFGAEASTYRDARERPISLQMDDVFDSKKDVIDLGEHTPQPTVARQEAAAGEEMQERDRSPN